MGGLRLVLFGWPYLILASYADDENDYRRDRQNEGSDEGSREKREEEQNQKDVENDTVAVNLVHDDAFQKV